MRFVSVRRDADFSSVWHSTCTGLSMLFAVVSGTYQSMFKSERDIFKLLKYITLPVVITKS